MSNIDEMAKNFKDLAEMKTYADAQYKTIVNLSKRINQLEEENLDLKKKMEAVKDGAGPTQEVLNSINFGATDEESICRMQLKLLKDISLERELSLEEAKKVDIYSKILTQLSSKDKKKDNEASPEKLDDGALLKMLEGLSGGT